MSLFPLRLRSAALPACILALAACASTDKLVAPDATTPAQTAYVGGAATVVISQVYGGGGNSGAFWKNDFIEIYNATADSVNLAGWSVQYASATGTSWQVTPLTGKLGPGRYYLIQEAAGTTAGTYTNLPTPDASASIPMAAGAGKVALVSSTTPLTGSGCPQTSQSSIVDYVGYGSTANCSETAPTATIDATKSVARKDGGKTDDNNNSSDFAVTTPITPRNITSDLNPTTPQNPVATVTVNPATGSVAVNSTVTFSASAKDASNNPTGTTLVWSSSDNAIATINPTTGVAMGVSIGQVTITAKSANNIEGTATLDVTVDGNPPPVLPSVRFSEIHYDNLDTDVGEGIEIEAPAGTNLTGYKVGLYSLSAGVVTNYDTRTLSGIVGAQCGARGIFVLEYPSNGIQNGPSDGMALIDPSGAVIEFLSWEGTLTATFGATNITSTDIGASQTSAPIGTSLQRNMTTGVWASAASNFYGCNGLTEGRALTGFAFSGRSPTADPPLPVGFEAQIFATAKQGTTTVPHTWSSDTPDIATIDADGVITAKAAGTAVFRATTTDGLSTATYSLQMADGVQSATAYVGNAAFGEPADGNPADDFIIRRAEYTTSFNINRNTPNWVAYDLDASHTATGADRCNCFTYDPELLQFGKRYTTNEYTGVGNEYNRGHMVRSSDRTTGTLDNAHTYYFSNVVPQAADNNQGPWAAFETYLGNLARNDDKEVYIIAGVAGNIGTLKNEGDVVIPENVWKVAVIMPRDKGLADLTSLASAEVIAVIMPNVNGIRNVPWQSYKTTVDAVEALSGYDLLANIRDDLETAIESNTAFPIAAVTGPFTEVAGTPIAMSAAASTDPDGDALTFAWSFGDGAVASGVNVTHTFSTAGTFNVRVIATDIRGLADTTFTTATVLTAAQAVGKALAEVTALQENGTLNSGNANSLASKLTNAQGQAERGGKSAALGMLGAVQNELDALVRTGRVTEASIAALRSYVQRAAIALQL